MKLSIIMDTYGNPFAGTESQVLKLVQGLVEAGWTVRFAVLRGSDYTRSGKFPVKVDELNIGSISHPRSWLRMHRYARSLKAEGFRVVHCFFNDTSVIGPPLLRSAGLRSIISRRDMGFWYTPAYQRMLRLTGRFVSAAICNSQAVAELTSHAENLPIQKVHVIYNGYPAAKGSLRSNNNGADQNPQRIVIGIVANLRPIKRIEDLICTVGRLVEAGHSPELHVVGGGDQAPYKALIAELKLTSHVVFFGSQPDPEMFIRKFDIAVLCSESEGFSNAIIEYMRCGKPVVCTRAGGNSEIISDGVNGYLAEVGDVEDLTDKIALLIEQPDLRERMGREGASRIEKSYSIQRMLAEHTALYHALAPEAASL